MSTLAQHQRHIGALRDIGDIMAALKNISLIESQRLRRFLTTQQRVMDGIELAMADFLGHFPHALTIADNVGDSVLLIGSERGFCGDFNERVADQLNIGAAEQHLVAVGEKLGGKLNDMGITAETLPGLSTVEDVPDVLLAVVDKLRELTARHGSLQLTIIHHHYDGHTLEVRSRRPFHSLSPDETRPGYPPLLNVASHTFFAQLLDHYLFAVLQGVLYASLAAEHQLRLQHLQGAIEHIDKRCDVMARRYNALRQELITEEIELIVLSAETRMQQ